MAKFPSLWGDLEVRDDNISPPTDETKTKPAAVEEKKETDEEIAARETEEDKNLEVDDTKKPEKPEKKEGDEGDEGEEEYDFTPEDVSKAYTMLLEEGVLDLSEEDEFEESTKGIADAVAATVRNKVQEEFSKVPPVVNEFYQHISAGNDPGSFVESKKTIKWADYDDSTEEAQEEALMKYHTSLGLTPEDAQEEIDDAKAAGKLDKKSQIALSSLKAQEEKEDQQKAAAQAKAEKDAEIHREKEIKELQKTIDESKEIAGFELDDEKKKNFKDYLFKVNPRTGKTQMQENMANEERRMSIAFLDFVNYTKADLEKEVATNLTKTRRKKLTRYTDMNVKNSNSSAAVKTKSTARKGKVVFPSIFGSQTIETED